MGFVSGECVFPGLVFRNNVVSKCNGKENGTKADANNESKRRHDLNSIDWKKTKEW